MHICTPRHGLARAIPALGVAALLALCCSTGIATAAVSAPKPHLAGTWSGKYSGAFSGTFTLRWTLSGSKLKGTIALSNPRGRYGINGSVHGRSITFGAVGAGATYTGSVSGKSMSGHYKSPNGGGSWSAKMTS
jgi:hypothetical protein